MYLCVAQVGDQFALWLISVEVATGKQDLWCPAQPQVLQQQHQAQLSTAGEQGLTPGSALTQSSQWQSEVPSSSSSSGCTAPPGTAAGISGSGRAGLGLLQQPWKSCDGLSVQDPAPFGERPVLFAGISCSPSTKGHLSLPPPFYQPSVARPFHGSFTAVTADLLYKIFPPAYFSLLFFLFPNYYYFKLLLLLLFKYV